MWNEIVAMVVKGTIQISPALLTAVLSVAGFMGGAGGYYVKTESAKETHRQVEAHAAEEHAHPSIDDKIDTNDRRLTIIEQTTKANQTIAATVQKQNEKDHAEINKKLDAIMRKLGVP